MRILVTGSNGALGHAFKLLEDTGDKWIFTTSKDGDLTNPSDVFLMLNEHKPDAIIHCAALSGGVGISAKYPATLLRDNVLMSLNILENAKLLGVYKTIMTLSSGMYTPSAAPIVEDAIHQEAPHQSNYAYAHAKRLIEPMIRAYREQFDMNIIGLVPNGIFGENDYFGLEDCNMTAAMISKFYAASKTGEDIVLWGDGTPLRELTYAHDLARAYMWAMENYDEPNILNVGNTDEVSVKGLAYEVSANFGIAHSRIQWDTSKPNGPFRKPTDNTKFLNLSNFKYTAFDIALNNTIAWYLEMQRSPELLRTGRKV
jgi:GDP-L-fucose synthase